MLLCVPLAETPVRGWTLTRSVRRPYVFQSVTRIFAPSWKPSPRWTVPRGHSSVTVLRLSPRNTTGKRRSWVPLAILSPRCRWLPATSTGLRCPALRITGRPMPGASGAIAVSRQSA
jgi:hypothetical protein